MAQVDFLLFLLRKEPFPHRGLDSHGAEDVLLLGGHQWDSAAFVRCHSVGMALSISMGAGPKHIQSAALLRLLRLLRLLEHGKYRAAVGATSLTNVVVIYLDDRLLSLAWDHGRAVVAVIVVVDMVLVHV